MEIQDIIYIDGLALHNITYMDILVYIVQQASVLGMYCRAIRLVEKSMGRLEIGGERSGGGSMARLTSAESV